MVLQAHEPGGYRWIGRGRRGGEVPFFCSRFFFSSSCRFFSSLLVLPFFSPAVLDIFVLRRGLDRLFSGFFLGFLEGPCTPKDPGY